MLRVRKGQSILEYAILMGVIVAVMIVIQIYVKRAVAGNLKAKADQIGEQFYTGGTGYTVQKISQTARTEERLAGDTDASTGKAWEKSRIDATGELGTGFTNLGTYAPNVSAYTGAEVNVTDYVTPSGGQTVGVHSTMDSGVLKDKQLFHDDEQ